MRKNINEKIIYSLTRRFWEHIKKTQEKNYFEGDTFDKFPEQCCGEASYLLAEFLRFKAIPTIYVWGEEYEMGTHAWLVVKDGRVNELIRRKPDMPTDILDVWNAYRGAKHDEMFDVGFYNENDIDKGLIIDITANQFGREAIYVGYMNEFYKSFDFKGATDYDGLPDDRLTRLFNLIMMGYE